MDVTPWFPAQGITTYDLSNMSKDAKVGLARQMSAILGTIGPVVTDFICTQTPTPSLTVKLTAGQIYQLTDIDSTPIGSLDADTKQILQQGYVAAQDIALNAGGLSSGQSKWWLIQVQFEQKDQVREGDPTGGRRGFYNSEDPSMPLDGIDGLGGLIPTVRLGRAKVTAIAGVAATSGTNVPPTPSAGCVPLFLINVSYGATAITNGQIQKAGNAAYAGYQEAPFLAGLLNQHHTGAPGQAPKIDVTKEIQNVVPYSNLPVSNTSPPAAGGNISNAGIVPIFTIGTVDPTGNVAGNVQDVYYNKTLKKYFVCITSGTSGTAVWDQINTTASVTMKLTLVQVTGAFAISGSAKFYEITTAATGSLPPNPADGSYLYFCIVAGTGKAIINADGSDIIYNAGIAASSITIPAGRSGVMKLVAGHGGWYVS